MGILSGIEQYGILTIMVNWKSGGLVFLLGFAANSLLFILFINKRGFTLGGH